MSELSEPSGGKLTTHVLDTMNGCPGSGMQVSLMRIDDEDGEHTMLRFVLDSDGRHANGPILEGARLLTGRYRFIFEVGQYFRDRKVALAEPVFLDRVPIEFGIADPAAHYHVPLLVGPWSYSTYRGS